MPVLGVGEVNRTRIAPSPGCQPPGHRGTGRRRRRGEQSFLADRRAASLQIQDSQPRALLPRAKRLFGNFFPQKVCKVSGVRAETRGIPDAGAPGSSCRPTWGLAPPWPPGPLPAWAPVRTLLRVSSPTRGATGLFLPGRPHCRPHRPPDSSCVSTGLAPPARHYYGPTAVRAPNAAPPRAAAAPLHSPRPQSTKTRAPARTAATSGNGGRGLVGVACPAAGRNLKGRGRGFRKSGAGPVPYWGQGWGRACRRSQGGMGVARPRPASCEPLSQPPPATWARPMLSCRSTDRLTRWARAQHPGLELRAVLLKRHPAPPL